MIRSTIREYYILSALMRSGISMITAMYVTFLISKGLNLFEVNIVNFVFFITLFFCEIPTGAFADVFGRKASFIVSCLLFALSMLMYGFSETFWGFIAAEIVGGVANTFSSGAFRAWFVDKLHHHGYTGRLEPIFARAQQIRHGVGILAALLGAWLADYSMALPWFIGAGCFILTAVMAIKIKEEYFIPQRFSFRAGFEAMKETVRASIAYGVNSKNVRFVLILVIVQIFAIQAPNMQWQPFFRNNVTDQTTLGFIWAGMALSMMLGAWLAPKLLRKIQDERRTLVICQIIIGAGITLTAVIDVLPITLLVFMLHEVARGGFEPIKEAYLHDNIPSKQRATIESFESLAHHGGGMVGLLVSGFLALRAGIPLTWTILGLTLIVTTLMIAKNGRTRAAVITNPCP